MPRVARPGSAARSPSSPAGVPAARRGSVSSRKPSRGEVDSFIGASFRSVWAFELLCLLARYRDNSLTHAEMVAGLRGSDLVVSQSIESLNAAGLILVQEDGAARYRPTSAELDRLFVEAQALYLKSPDAVRRTIVAAANPSITAFADAFRLRGD